MDWFLNTFLCVSRMELYYLLSWRTFSQQHLKSKMLDESIILHIYWNCTCSTFEYLIMLVYMESVGKSCVNSSNLLIVCVVFYSGFVTDIFILSIFLCITFSFCVAYSSPWSSDPYKDCAEKNVLGGLSLEGFLSKVFCLILSIWCTTDKLVVKWGSYLRTNIFVVDPKTTYFYYVSLVHSYAPFTQLPLLLWEGPNKSCVYVVNNLTCSICKLLM